MPFWSSQRIEQEQARVPLIEPAELFNSRNIRHGAYNLTLSREVLTTPDGNSDRSLPGEGPTLMIPPGQFAVLFSNESVRIPNDVIGWISISTQEKWKGLINISGFHVTPGFHGCLKFTVFNAGNRPIHLAYGEKYFLLWFASLDQATRDPYNGPFNGQDKISPADREQMSERRHSPDTLHERLEKIEGKVDRVQTVGLIVVAPLLVGLGIAVFGQLFKEINNSADSGELFIIGVVSIIALLIGASAGVILRHIFKYLFKE
jgi:dCTP deaminase